MKSVKQITEDKSPENFQQMAAILKGEFQAAQRKAELLFARGYKAQHEAAQALGVYRMALQLDGNVNAAEIAQEEARILAREDAQEQRHYDREESRMVAWADRQH